jgi:hypothetical protein
VVTLGVAGRLHHVGVGRTHARTHLVMLVNDLQVRIVNAATGELLRELTIAPAATTNPLAAHPAGNANDPEPNLGCIEIAGL